MLQKLREIRTGDHGIESVPSSVIDTPYRYSQAGRAVGPLCIIKY